MAEANKNLKIIIPGAAGLVGQNLIIELKKQGYTNIVALDKYRENLEMLEKLHPDITVIEADVSEPGDWQQAFAGGDVVVMLQAQIGSKYSDDFIRNNTRSAECVVDTMKQQKIPYIVHISSSVVESAADDDYTNTKKAQERIVLESGLDYTMLRPTLMFGWFDRKHLGWLSRFMKKVPLFPIPGSGKVTRQPLYVVDFCRIIVSAIRSGPHNKIFDITGREKITYVDIIRKIKSTVGAKCVILSIPYSLFWILLKIYAMFDSNPPFTTDQLEALVAADEFEVIPWWDIFNVKPTPFDEAIRETFCDPEYSNYTLKF